MPKETFYRLPNTKKERIIKGAIDSFNRLSYDQVTVADIVSDCQIPRGSFYMYFEDKFDLFVFLIEQFQEDKLKYLDDVIKQVGKKPFIELYPDMLKAGLEFARQHPKLYRFGYHLFNAQDEKVKGMYNEIMVRGITMIETFIKKDQVSGFTRDDLNAHIVATVLHQLNARDVVSMFYEGKSDEEILSYAKEVLKIIRYGIEREDEDGKSI